MIIQYLIVLKDYFIEILPHLVIGLLLSGLIHEFVPSRWIEKRLGGAGVKPVLYSTAVGMILPLCCLGALPMAVSLRQKGAALGPVLAFLVAAPAASIASLLVAHGILGAKFTVFKFFAVITMGLVMGLVGNMVRHKAKVFAPPAEHVLDPVCARSAEAGKAIKSEWGGESYYLSCPNYQRAFPGSQGEHMGSSRQIMHRVRHVLKYIFVDMIKEIGPELLLGLALAALVATVALVGEFIGAYFRGGWGYLFSLTFSLLRYTSSITSIHMVDAFVSQGMNIGAGMVLLLAGPITSWGTILILRKEFGDKILAIYLAVICVMSLALGFCFSLI